MHGAIREVLGLLRSQADTGVKWRLSGALLLVTLGGLLAGLAPLALKAMVDTLVGLPARRRIVVAGATTRSPARRG